MKTNVGNIERVVRIAVGVVLVCIAATNTVGWRGWPGVVRLAAARVASAARGQVGWGV